MLPNRSDHDATLASIMIGVKGNRKDDIDLHAQVAAEIRRAIADGEAKPGERLPPAKDLAAVIGVNTNTVLRALRTLRDEGLLEFAAATASRSLAPRTVAPSPPGHAISLPSLGRTATTCRN